MLSRSSPSSVPVAALAAQGGHCHCHCHCQSAARGRCHCRHHCRCLSLLAREVAIAAIKCHCLSKPLPCCRGRCRHCRAPPCQRQATPCLLQMPSSCVLVVIVEVVTAAVIVVGQGGGGVAIIHIMPLIMPVPLLVVPLTILLLSCRRWVGWWW